MLQLLLFFTLLSRTITIVQYIFITEIFKPQLFSSCTTYLYTRLTEFWIAIACSVCPLISLTMSDEYIWRRMSLPSRNLYKCKQIVYFNKSVFYLHCYPLFLYCTLLFFVYSSLPSLSPFFILMLLLYLCLSAAHVNRPIIIVFEAVFFYQFNNTISNFVKISSRTTKWCLN